MTPQDLRTRREALHLTQQQLADALGVAQSNLARWESEAVAITEMRGDWLELRLARLERQPVT